MILQKEVEEQIFFSWKLIQKRWRIILELNLAHACCTERRAKGSSGCASQPGYTTLRGRQDTLKAASRRGYSTPQLPQQVSSFQLPAKNRVCTAKPFNTKPSAHHTRFFVHRCYWVIGLSCTRFSTLKELFNFL